MIEIQNLTKRFGLFTAVDDISKTVGIRTVPSRDTHHYSAKGKFDLGDEFDAAVERERGPAPPAPIPAPVA